MAAPDDLGLADIAWPLISDGADRIVEQLTAALSEGVVSEAAANTLLDRMIAAGFEQVFRASGQMLAVELGAAHSTGLLAGDTPEEQYEFFVRCLADPDFGLSVIDRYPALERQLWTIVDNWANANVELLERIRLDRYALVDRFRLGGEDGLLADIVLSQGDSHRSGRTTAVLQFTSGKRLVYKPRSLAAEVHFRNFAEWFNNRLGEERLFLADCIDRGSYGWCEFVEPASGCGVEDVRHYFRSFGSLLSVSYVLGITDLHSENLIARGKWPVLVDLETLLSPLQVLGVVDGAERALARIMRESVLATGLLPMRVPAANSAGSTIDLSGISDLAGQITPFELPAWMNARTVDMRLDYRRRTLEGHDNAMRSEEGIARPDAYCEDLIAGFVEAYDLLEANRHLLKSSDGPVSLFRDDTVRVVIRPTFLYEHFLTAGSDPEYLTAPEIKEAYLVGGLTEVSVSQPALRAAIGSETSDLLENDIPYFSADIASTELMDARGERLDGILDRSGLEAAFRRLDRLDLKDRELQCRLIRVSLARADLDVPAPAVRLAVNEAKDLKELARGVARAIADRLSRQAISDDAGGRCSWITVCEGPGGTLAPVLAGLDLYSGIPGIALFLAAAGDVLNCEDHRSCARGAVEEILQRLDRGESISVHGAYTGRPGLAYALGCIGQYFPDLRLHERAVEVVFASGDFAATSGEVDIVSGLSGTLLACLSVREGTLASDQRNRLLELVHSLGGILMKQLKSEEAVAALPAGFAHGRAGLAFALKQLERQTGNEQAGSLARSIISELAASAERDGDGSTSWCRGSCGIALATNRVETRLGPTGLQRDARLNDCLCHGGAGTVMIRQALNAASMQEEDIEAARFLETIVRGGVRCGVINGIESPALMDGLAGVGLAALAIAAPERVPNVLTLGLAKAC